MRVVGEVVRFNNTYRLIGVFIAYFAVHYLL